MEEDRGQPVDARLERRLAILVPEESRVAQPRRQHALGVARDDLRLLRLHVGHGQERRLQLALFIHHREVVLMVNHRRRQHFLGKLEELDRDVPGDDRRVLDEVRHFLQQRRMRRDETADPPAQLARVRLQLAADLLLALGAIEDDEVLEQARLIVVERLDLDGATGAAAGRQEAMAVGVRPPNGCPAPSVPAPARSRRMTNGTTRPPYSRTSQRIGRANDEIALAVFEIRVPPHLLRERQSREAAPP